MNQPSSLTIRIAIRLLGAAGATVFFVGFLVSLRLYFADSEPVEIRELLVAEEFAPPPPPPPKAPSLEEITPQKTTPTPPKLPQLEIQIEQIAPPVKAVVDQRFDLAMVTSDFELEVDPIKPPAPTSVTKTAPRKTTVSAPSKPAAMKTTYSAGELDAKPRLTNRPAATFPKSLLRKGVKQGKVLLEVSISPSGRCSVKRVVASSHPEFSAMARSFASKARFTAPKKNGRAVTAIYRWPLVLRP